MSFWLSVANFLNGLAWTTYALFHPLDIYVLVIKLDASFFTLLSTLKFLNEILSNDAYVV